MDDVSYDELIERLAGDAGPDDAVANLVLAAAEGPDVLAALLEGGPAPGRRAPVAAAAPEPKRVYLEQVAVANFRGIADRARLQFAAGPGLTLVVGRNGSGKSSFAEALELLLTGENLRWEGRPATWKEGWRNLHASGPTCLEARFRVDGHAEPLEIRQSWPEGVTLKDAGDVEVTGPAAEWSALGWDEPLRQFRPILSYNEIGAMFSDRAADLYDALSAVLGLEPFDRVQATLREARLARDKTAKTEKQVRGALKATLAGSADERAVAVLAELARRTPDLDRIQALLTGGGGDPDVAALQALAQLPVPATEIAEDAFAAAEAAAARVEALERTDAERDAQLAGLLEQAVAFHATHGDTEDTCPLCGTAGALGPGWSLRAQADADRLRRSSSDLRAARNDAAAARRRTEALFAEHTPAALRAAALDTEEALRAWDAWSSSRDSRERALELRRALETARAGAAAELERRDAGWRPLQDEIVRWLGVAREAARDGTLVAGIAAAEDWMKGCTATLRSERLKPVVDAAQANWAELRHESNVALGEIELRKSGNVRSAIFDVTVDGSASSALGVMSQGELSALAISVFLPRASLLQSPFGFMVIDDPVQSMDPAKVDGLARVLARAAETRQVVVFTHDERLPQAIDRLGIEARVMNVKRRAKSKVEIVAGTSPSERYLTEAFALCKTDDLPDEVRARVVPGFCRSAIEAACATRIRRRRLAEGVSHAEIESDLAAKTSLNTWLADAFGVPVAQGQAIYDRVRQLGGEPAVQVVQLSKQGTHTLIGKDALELARGAEKLVERLEAAT